MRNRARIRAALLIAVSVQLACDPKPNDPPEAPWPSTPECEGLDEWPVEWAELERDALALVDAARDEAVARDTLRRFYRAPRAPRADATE